MRSTLNLPTCLHLGFYQPRSIHNAAAAVVSSPPSAPPTLQDAAAVKGAEEEEPAAESMDVYLSLINGVINAKKHMKWDNGALQVR